MLNKIILMGRLTTDPETKFLQSSNNSVTRFPLAVERDYKAEGEEKPKADFFDCVAWNSTGEFIAKHFKKGSLVALIGSVETGSYTNAEGVKVRTTEVKVDKVYFTGEKRADQSGPVPAPESDGFMNIPDEIEDDFPFK